MITPHQLTTIYVSQTKGNNNWTGFSPEPDEKHQGPMQSIEWALYRIEEMRSFGMNQPVTVRLTDPEYVIENPIVFRPGMTGITIDSEDGCLVSGGMKITGFVHDTFQGVSCFSAPVPQLAEGLWFTDFYVDGLRADFTRYPREGTLSPQQVENNGTELMDSSSYFIAKKEDLEVIRNFKNFGDCFISYNHYWIDEHSPIQDYDLESGKITFTYPSRFTISPDKDCAALHYVIENVAETFSQPNQWYLDRTAGRIYYIPRDDSQTPESICAYAPLTSQLFDVLGTPEQKIKNVRFRNLTFAYTKGDYSSKHNKTNDIDEPIESGHPGYASDIQSVCFAHGSITFSHAENCEITGCTLRNFGVHGIDIQQGCHGIRITDNFIFDGGAGGIKIDGGKAGSDPLLHTYGNTVSNNIIRRCGRRYLAACGILVKHSYENTLSHNEISDLYYSGISVGWVWGYTDSITRDNLIEANHIYHLGQGKLSDMGGIYLLGKQPGTVVRGNLIHDVVSDHYGGWGLYTDEGSSYITLENNICYRLKCNCYHQHYGSMNTVRNNIFVLSENAPVFLTRNEYHVGLLCERNIIVSNGTPIYQVGNSEVQTDGAVHVLTANRNLMFDLQGDTKLLKIGDKSYSLEEARTVFGMETEGVTADPMFADLQNGDYTLSPDSPAFALGFQPINMTHVGADFSREE